MNKTRRLASYFIFAVAVDALIIALSGNWRALEIVVGVLLAP